MKTLWMGAAFILMWLTGAFSQGKGISPDVAARRLTDKQTKLLSLKPTQNEQLFQTNLQYFQARDSISAHPEADNTARMQEWQHLNETRNSQYRNLFSADQYKTWNDWLLHHRRKLREKMKHPKNKSSHDSTGIIR